MKKYLSLVLVPLLFASCKQETKTASQPQKNNTLGSIEVLDESLKAIIDPNSPIEILAEGYGWSEGPEWVEDGQFLLFSDTRMNNLYKWEEGKGASLYLDNPGFDGPDSLKGKGSNGLYVNDQGQLILCQHGRRQIGIMDAPLSSPEDKYTTLVSHYEGKKMNSPNDLAFDSDGNLYFTDPPYGLTKQDDDPAKELDVNGVYKLTPDGVLTLLVDSLNRPNGIALSKDEKTLYVANSQVGNIIWCAYELDDNGIPTSGKTFFDASAMLSDKNPGLADGLRVDKNDNIFATGPGGVLIFNKAGKHLGTIRTEVASANCEIDEKGKYLYITSTMRLLRVKLK